MTPDISKQDLPPPLLLALLSLIALVAVVAAIIWLNPETLWFTQPLIGGCAALLAGATSLVTYSRHNKKLKEDLPALQSLRVDYLWVLVFAFGTAMAFLIPIEMNQGDEPRIVIQRILTDLTPRLFVVWFLSLLTLVATRILTNLSRLQALLEKIGSTVKEATGATGALVTATEKSKASSVVLEKSVDTIGKTVKAAQEEMLEGIRKTTLEARKISRQGERNLIQNAEVIGLDKKFGDLITLERGIRKRGLATTSFLSAANHRCRLVHDIVAQVLGEHPGRDSELGFVYDHILIPSLLPYLGTDPWQSLQKPGITDDGLTIGVLQEGSYFPYAMLIERIFLSILMYGEQFQQEKKARFEVFTTLNFGPGHWYNVTIPGNWPAGEVMGSDSVFLDRWSRTAPLWERYRAVQALAVDRGREKGFLGLTRCFVPDPKERPWGFRPLERDIWVPKESLEVTERLIDETRRALLASLGRDDKSFDPVEWGLSPERVETLISELGIKLWTDSVRLPAESGDPYETDEVWRAAQNGQGYSFPVLYDKVWKDRNEEPAVREAYYQNLRSKAWWPLLVHIHRRYFSSEARALQYLGTEDPSQLPKDIFAVGYVRDADVKDEDFPAAPLQFRNWHPVFLLELDTDELATTTSTCVFVPGKVNQTFQNRGAQILSAIERFLDPAFHSRAFEEDRIRVMEGVWTDDLLDRLKPHHT